MSHTTRKNDPTGRNLAFSSVYLQAPSPAPSLSFLWYLVFAGATDQTKTVQAPECVPGHIWSEKDAIAILEVVGNSAKKSFLRIEDWKPGISLATCFAQNTEHLVDGHRH